MQDSLADAAERLAISDVINLYAWAIDTKDFDQLHQVFDTDVEADFTGFGGKHVIVSRAEWVDTVRKTVGNLDATQHLLGNHRHRIDGDTAHMTAYLQAMHRYNGAKADTDYVIGGHYEIDLRKTDEGWRIRRYKLVVTWETGNRYIMREARNARG
ncbi:MAG: nuclear transport factor 2 family protein [Minwuia sp.]|uniref:nuclear transport factor 2 family protein n=1 Tax=Minwuia sp. TaxID=2493630 RepID=UPI003A83B5EA